MQTDHFEKVNSWTNVNNTSENLVKYRLKYRLFENYTIWNAMSNIYAHVMHKHIKGNRMSIKEVL